MKTLSVILKHEPPPTREEMPILRSYCWPAFGINGSYYRVEDVKEWIREERSLLREVEAVRDAAIAGEMWWKSQAEASVANK